MKIRVLIALFAGLACVPAFSADKVSELMAQGKKAEQDGNAAGAKAAYTQVLQIDPANANARYLLTQLSTNSGAMGGRARQKTLSEIVIPQVDFENVPFSEAVEALGVMTEKASGEKKFAPNFMIQDTTGKLGGQTLSLKVKNVPAEAVLKMMLDQVGAKAKYDEHAVVIRSTSAAG